MTGRQQTWLPQRETLPPPSRADSCPDALEESPGRRGSGASAHKTHETVSQPGQEGMDGVEDTEILEEKVNENFPNRTKTLKVMAIRR